MSNSTERYNDYIEQLAREDIREAEIKYQENVAALEEVKRQVWNEALEAVLRLPYRIGPSLDADDGFFINVGQIKALLKRDAIRAMKKEPKP